MFYADREKTSQDWTVPKGHLTKDMLLKTGEEKTENISIGRERKGLSNQRQSKGTKEIIKRNSNIFFTYMLQYSDSCFPYPNLLGTQGQRSCSPMIKFPLSSAVKVQMLKSPTVQLGDARDLDPKPSDQLLGGGHQATTKRIGK